MVNAKADLYESIFAEVARRKYNCYPSRLIRPLLEWAVTGGTSPDIGRFRAYTMEPWEFNLLTNVLFPEINWMWARIYVNDSGSRGQGVGINSGILGGQKATGGLGGTYSTQEDFVREEQFVRKAEEAEYLRRAQETRVTSQINSERERRYWAAQDPGLAQNIQYDKNVRNAQQASYEEANRMMAYQNSFTAYQQGLGNYSITTAAPESLTTEYQLNETQNMIIKKLFGKNVVEPEPKEEPINPYVSGPRKIEI